MKGFLLYILFVLFSSLWHVFCLLDETVIYGCGRRRRAEFAYDNNAARGSVDVDWFQFFS